MAINVCIAGATGWAGSALAKAVHQVEDMKLVSAVPGKIKARPSEVFLNSAAPMSSFQGLSGRR